MSSASSHRLACGWICSVWFRVCYFFFKILQLSLAERNGPSKGPWVVWHQLCSHTYSVREAWLCTHMPRPATRSTVQFYEHSILPRLFFICIRYSLITKAQETPCRSNTNHAKFTFLFGGVDRFQV